MIGAANVVLTLRVRTFRLAERDDYIAIISLRERKFPPFPHRRRRRPFSAGETAAIAAIQTIHKMEVQYQSQYGRYAVSLTELGPPASGAPSPAAADLIGNDLSNGTNKGFKFTLTGTQGGYVIQANPVNFGSDGSRTFYSDQSMVIRNNFGQEPATANSPELRN